jgi:hypothetical protein
LALRNISEAKNPEMRGSFAAMKRAAALARKIAVQTETGIIVVRDGRPIRIPAVELLIGDYG